MDRMDTNDRRIPGYLFGIGYHKWSRALSTIKQTWTMTSNIAESIINQLARKLLIVSLLDFMGSQYKYKLQSGVIKLKI